jgi:UDP-N-acetylmuramoylalanine--D-glutamate ligase
LTKTFSEGAYIKNNKMEISINQEEFTMDTEYIALEGTHEKTQWQQLCGKIDAD